MEIGLASIWRKLPERYNLLGSKCMTCGEIFFPTKQICPNCRRAGKLENMKLPQTGTVFSFTEVHAPPKGLEYMVPYVLAMIKMDNGPLVTAQLVDARPEEIKIGMHVKLAFRKISESGKSGIIHYGYAFTPVK